jgi:hypothetical protein
MTPKSLHQYILANVFGILTHQEKYRKASLNDGDILRKVSLGDFVVVRTCTYTQIVQCSLLHT